MVEIGRHSQAHEGKKRKRKGKENKRNKKKKRMGEEVGMN